MSMKLTLWRVLLVAAVVVLGPAAARGGEEIVIAPEKAGDFVGRDVVVEGTVAQVSVFPSKRNHVPELRPTLPEPDLHCCGLPRQPQPLPQGPGLGKASAFGSAVR